MDQLVPIAGLFLGSFAVAFSGALVPGPLLTYTIAETGRRGASAGPLLMCGHSALELVMVTLLVLGIGPFLKQDAVVGTIGLAGAAVLLWIAVDMFKSVPRLSAEALRKAAPARGETGKTTTTPILYGVLMSVANPYWIIWWITIGLGYISTSISYGVAGVSAFYVGHILADFLWYSAVSFGLAKGGRFLSDHLYRSIIILCAVGLVVFGVWFGQHGVWALARVIRQ